MTTKQNKTLSKPSGITFAAFLLCMSVTGCSSMSGGDGSMLDKTLELVGITTPEVPASPVPLSSDTLKTVAATRLPLRIHASDQLNVTERKKSLALVAKIYSLQNADDFLRTPYDTFAKDAYASKSVIAVREVVLLPGQKYEVEERLPKEARYLAVVGMFRAPEESRWRFVFDVANSAEEGITIGAHQCALSVSRGKTVGSTPEAQRLAGTACN